jgi:hypothetical protein
MNTGRVRVQVLVVPTGTSGVLDHFDRADRQQLSRGIEKLLFGAGDVLLVDRGVSSELVSGSEPVLASTRAGAERVQRREGVADDGFGMAVLFDLAHKGLHAVAQERDAVPEGRRAFVGEKTHGEAPPSIQLADHAMGGNLHVVEEDLAELLASADDLDRPDSDAWGVHVDEEDGDTPVS